MGFSWNSIVLLSISLSLLIALVILSVRHWFVSDSPSSLEVTEPTDGDDNDFSGEEPEVLVVPLPTIALAPLKFSEPLQYNRTYYLYAFNETTHLFHLVRGDSFVSIDPLFDALPIEFRFVGNEEDERQVISQASTCRLYSATDETFLTTLDDPVRSPLTATSNASGWGIVYSINSTSNGVISLHDPFLLQLKASNYYPPDIPTPTLLLYANSNSEGGFLYHTPVNNNVSEHVFIASLLLQDTIDTTSATTSSKGLPQTRVSNA